MKKILLPLLLVLSYVSFGQPVINRSGASVTVADQNLFVVKSFRPPVYLDTTAANAAGTGLDSCGKFIYTYSPNAMWYRQCFPKKWLQVASGSSAWNLTGNIGTTAGTNFVGTTDAQDVVFKRNSTEITRLNSTGLNIVSGLKYQYNSVAIAYAQTALNNWYFANAGNLTGTGADNIGIGSSALIANTTGNYNIALGKSSLSINTTGEGNVSIGSNSAMHLTTGNLNTMVGYQAGNNLTTGGNNIFLGISDAGQGILTGNYNVIIGNYIAGLSSSLNNNIVIADGQGNKRIWVNNVGKQTYGTYGVATHTGTPATYPAFSATGELIESATPYSPITASNGLTKTGNDIKLGGTLTGNTTINSGTYSLTLVGTVGAALLDVTNYGSIGAQIVGTSGTGLIARSTTGVAIGAEIFPATTNSVAAVQTFSRGTTGTAANGIGGSLDYYIEANDGANYISNQLISKFTTAASATRTSQFILTGINSGATVDLFTLSSSAVALGYLSTASATSSSSIGYSNTASATNSSAFGYSSTANAANSSAVGYNNTSSGSNSSAIGNTNIASFTNASAVGYGNTSSNSNSSAIGYGNLASNSNASAVGYGNIASGDSASAFGNSNTSAATRASAFGYGNSVTGSYANALGANLTAKDTYGTVVGAYNDTTSASSATWNTLNKAFQVGIGNPTGSTRVNAFEILFSGKAKLNKYGIGTFTGTPTYNLVVDASGNVVESATPVGAGSYWAITGNTATVAGTNFLGTTDAVDVVFKRNATEITRLNSTGLNLVSGLKYQYNSVPIAYGQTALFNWYFGNSGNLTGSGVSNTAIGDSSLVSNTTGSRNTAIGKSLGSNTTGLDNVAIGYNTMNANSNGQENVSIGNYSMRVNTSGSENVAVGYNTLYSNTTGAGNVAVGYLNLYTNTTGQSNVSVGYQSMRLNTTGGENAAYGTFALRGNTTGSNSVAVGFNALYNNTTGGYNIGIGWNALLNLNIVSGLGGYNVAIGSNTGLGITTGQYNTIIGSQVTGLSATLSNNIIIADGQGNKRIWVDAAGATTFQGSVTGLAASFTTGTFSSQLNGQQGRFAGWYVSGTGAAAEIGVTGGIAYFQGYDRTGSVYVPTIVDGLTTTIQTGGVARLSITNAGASTFSGSLTGQAASFTTGAFSGTITTSVQSAINLSGAGDNDIKLTGAGSMRVINQAGTVVLMEIANGGYANFGGLITSTRGNNLQIFNSASATTGYQFMRFSNTGANLTLAIEGSVGGTLLTGGTAYATILTTYNATNLEFGTDATRRFYLDGTTGAATFASSVTGQAASFTTGDFSGQMNVTGQGRFKGWYASGTGEAAEIGVSGGTANVFGYNRTASAYIPLGLAGSTLSLQTSGANALVIDASQNSRFYGNVGIGIAPSTTAALLIKAGTVTVAPLKFTSGVNLTTAEIGAMEYNNAHFLTNWKLVRYSVGGTIKDYVIDSTAGGAEKDIYPFTTIANTLANDGDKLIASYGGNFVTVGTELTQLRVYFGGTEIWNSTALAPSSGTTSWRVYVEIIRVNSTTIRYTVSLNTTGATGYVYATSGQLAGLTLSNTNILKITGASSGVGSGSGDIVGKSGYILFNPAQYADPA